MFNKIKEILGTSQLQSTGRGGGGCINEGEIYNTDQGKVFIKRNHKDLAREMFDGEYASLTAISSTGTIQVPKPYTVVDNPAGGAVLVMECVEMKGLNKAEGLLGEQLARLHLSNIESEKSALEAENKVGSQGRLSGSLFVSKFGFDVKTCCGYLPQNNSWCDDWLSFYVRKLQEQISMLEKEYGDRQLIEQWSVLLLEIPKYFDGLDVKPSLLHGDLWSGNVAENSLGPVIYDPASFYGHHEYDLGIMKMFGGFGHNFWTSYHNAIPKSNGFNKRIVLYELFHHLNHWNHFGGGYRGSSLKMMKNLCKH